MRNLGQRIGRHGIGIDPRPLHVGDEHLRAPGDAEARVNALLAFVDQREVAALDVVDTIDGARRGRDVAGLDHRRAAGGSAARRRPGSRQARAPARGRRQTAGESLLDVRERALGALRELGEDPSAPAPRAHRRSRASACAPASSSRSRSRKNLPALTPGGSGAASRSAVNDMPPLQPGFDGPAGRRAARSASGVMARIRPSAEVDAQRLGRMRPRQ